MNEIDLSEFIQLIIKDKGGTYDQYNELMDYIAFHETGPAQRMDPSAKQEGGPGRGLFQFEEGKEKGGNLAVNRTMNYLKRNSPLGPISIIPEWLNDLWENKKSVDVSTLTADQQKILFLGYHRENPTSNFSDIWSGNQSIPDFWLQNHWAGKGISTEEEVAAKLDLFNKSMVAKDATDSLKVEEERLIYRQNTAPYLSDSNNIDFLPKIEDILKGIFGTKESSLVKEYDHGGTHDEDPPYTSYGFQASQPSTFSGTFVNDDIETDFTMPANREIAGGIIDKTLLSINKSNLNIKSKTLLGNFMKTKLSGEVIFSVPILEQSLAAAKKLGDVNLELSISRELLNANQKNKYKLKGTHEGKKSFTEFELEHQPDILSRAMLIHSQKFGKNKFNINLGYGIGAGGAGGESGFTGGLGYTRTFKEGGVVQYHNGGIGPGHPHYDPSFNAPADATYVQQPQFNIPIAEEEQYFDQFGSTGGSLYPSGPEPTLWEKIKNAGANPLGTFGYSVRGEDIPWGNVPRHGNPFDTFPLGYINPAAWYESGEAAVDEFKQGNILSGTLETLGATPVIPGSIGVAKKFLPKTSSLIKTTSVPSSKVKFTDDLVTPFKTSSELSTKSKIKFTDNVIDQTTYHINKKLGMFQSYKNIEDITPKQLAILNNKEGIINSVVRPLSKGGDVTLWRYADNAKGGKNSQWSEAFYSTDPFSPAVYKQLRGKGGNIYKITIPASKLNKYSADLVEGAGVETMFNEFLIPNSITKDAVKLTDDAYYKYLTTVK